MKHSLSPIAILWLGTAPMMAGAQVLELDEITVSANRAPTEISRSGSAVSVATREDLEQAGDIMLADFIARMPGISMTRNGGAGKSTSIRIRGAGQKYVAVYVDGVRIDDPSRPQVQSDLGGFMTADIERIEVLRGSQSALYGGSAVGGVVNITTLGAMDSDETGFRQSAMAEAGSFGTLSSRYSLQYGDERFQGAVNISQTRTDGFSAYEPAPGTPGLENDGFDAKRLSFSTRYQVSDALAVGMSGFVQDSESEYDDFSADADNVDKTDEVGGRLFALYDVGRTTHEFSLTRYQVKRRNFQPRGTPADRFRGERTTFGYIGTTDMAANLTLSYGADTEEEDATGGGNAPASTRTSGAFAQALWAPTNDLDVSANIRVDENSDFGTFWSGRVAVAWQASQDLTMRGAIARGFRAPAFTEKMGGTFPGFNVAGNTGLEPEESLSYELGAEYRFESGAIISGTLFALDVDNAITFCQLPGGSFGVPCPNAGPAGFTNQYQNLAGASERRGLELSAQLPVGERHEVTGVYTYTDARTPQGARLSRIPFHDMTLALGSGWTPEWRSTVSVTRVAGHTGGTTDYTVANATVRYMLTDTTEAYLRIENVLDRQYQTAAGFSASDRAAYFGFRASF